MLYLALLWHQHQPVYKDAAHPTQAGSYIHPWVRFHSIRDYYSMVALVAEHPNVHLTINLTPALLWQIADYVERGATDQALELTLKPAEAMDYREQEQVLSTFFDAHWHHQIFPHPRYKELFIQRREG
jgi:alpha-amylase/alpha-mannosidase (GH57 family)